VQKLQHVQRSRLREYHHADPCADIPTRNIWQEIRTATVVMKPPRQDLCARAFEFGDAVLSRFTRLSAGGAHHAHMALQLVKAATGIGALLEEGVVANSRRDMAAKYAIALRESRESRFWLRLFSKNPEWTDELAPLVQESSEFVAMLTVSVRKLRGL
jgi:four helix bundle protein